MQIALTRLKDIWASTSDWCRALMFQPSAGRVRYTSPSRAEKGNAAHDASKYAGCAVIAQAIWTTDNRTLI